MQALRRFIDVKIFGRCGEECSNSGNSESKYLTKSGTVEPRSKGFQGTNNLFSYGQTSVIANKENKRNQLEGTMNLHLL